MNSLRLLVIDPQNDFMDIDGAALPVPGAGADMGRLAGFIDTLQAQIDDIVVTLDSHPGVGIERTTFWSTGSGGPVAAFTPITAAATATANFPSASPADSPDINPNRWAPWSRPAAMALSSAGTINRANPKIGRRPTSKKIPMSGDAAMAMAVTTRPATMAERLNRSITSRPGLVSPAATARAAAV